MKAKKRSIIFPEIEVCRKANSLAVSRNDIRQLCTLNPLAYAIEGIANFAYQHTCTKELGKRLRASTAAVDAKYTEFENQAYIHFSELAKQTEEYYKAETQKLEIELQKAEEEADIAYRKSQIEFEDYLKTSTIYKKIFNSLMQSMDKTQELIKEAQECGITSNRYYFRLTEQYRRTLRGIERYSKFIS